VTTLGAERIGDFSVSIFPIPATNTLTIQFSKPLMQASLILTDLAGKIVLGKHENNTSYTILNISGLAKGIYILQITSDQGNSSRKIILE